MISRGHLNPNQLDILQTIQDRIKNQEKRTLISMPPGTGASKISSIIVHEYLPKLEQKDHILVICPATYLKEYFKNHLSLNQELSTTETLGPDEKEKLLILTETELFDTKYKDFKSNAKHFPLIFFLDYDPASKRMNATLEFFNNSMLVAFTSSEQPSVYFGALSFKYTTRDAIQDGKLTALHISKIKMEMAESHAHTHNRLVGNLNLTEQETNTVSEDQYESYLEMLCEDILLRIQDEKTLITVPTDEYATRISQALIRANGNSAFTTLIHARQNAGEVNQLIKDFNNEKFPQVLITVELASAIGNIRCLRNVVALKNYLSPSVLKRTLAFAQQPFPGKLYVNLFDYVGLDLIFKQIFDDEDSIPQYSELSLERKYVSETEIKFRDKKDIEAVLAVDELASELSDIIDIIPGEQGSMIGIFGTWGRGKTFLMDLIWKNLESKKKFTRVDFHAWKYQDTPATWAYLYERLAEKYFEGQNTKWITKSLSGFWKKVKLNRFRQGIWPAFKLFTIICIGLTVGTILYETTLDKEKGIKFLFEIFGIPAALSVIGYSVVVTYKKDYSAKAKDIFLKYSSKHSFKDHLGLQAEIQRETLILLKCWIPDTKIQQRKIVLFVEDIDRCNEGKVIQIIDSLRILLEDPEIAQRLVIIAAIDERILKLAIKNKYDSLLGVEKKEQGKHTLELQKITDEYMDKLFISGIKLGKLSSLDRDDFMLALTKSDRQNNSGKKTIDEILKEEQAYLDSMMTPQAYQDLVNSEIAAQEEEQFYMDNLTDQYPNYETDHLGSSSPIPWLQQGQEIKVHKDKLTNEEVDILRFAIYRYTEATPRQIRIFYYRYLLAKNLLARRYRKMGHNNIWIGTKHSKIIAKLIVAYTTTTEPDILQLHLENVMGLTSDNAAIELLDYTTVSTSDYRELLKILNMVIAY